MQTVGQTASSTFLTSLYLLLHCWPPHWQLSQLTTAAIDCSMVTG